MIDAKDFFKKYHSHALRLDLRDLVVRMGLDEHVFPIFSVKSVTLTFKQAEVHDGLTGLLRRSPGNATWRL
jgi:hypothetical protein